MEAILVTVRLCGSVWLLYISETYIWNGAMIMWKYHRATWFIGNLIGLDLLNNKVFLSIFLLVFPFLYSGVVQLLSLVWLFATTWTAVCQVSLSFTIRKWCHFAKTQTHVHWVGDAIQPSHPLSSPSSPAFNLSQHQGLFKWVSSLHQVAKVLELQLHH